MSSEVPAAVNVTTRGVNDVFRVDFGNTKINNPDETSMGNSERELKACSEDLQPRNATTDARLETPSHTEHGLANDTPPQEVLPVGINTAGICNEENSPLSDGCLEPIAIIGLSFEFPGDATSEESFWEMLLGKECAASEFPTERMNIDAFYRSDPQKSSSIHTRRAHFLKSDIRDFDAPFFSISPVEAGAMDPNQKGLMETTYHAIENAGLKLSDLSGSNTSVHVGFFASDHMLFNLRDSQQIPKYYATGSSASILSNRISWFFNLQGPSMTIDTACSSGLVALSLACEGLWAGKSSTAIVGASNLILTPELNIALSNMNFLSQDGKCYSFDDRASGYARGEGFASLILKPFSQAIVAGDTIRALIRGVGTNHDGFTQGGITQPSKDLQSRLIRETYQNYGLDMRKTRYFEAHGTGTAIGDPVEARAIGESFRSFRTKEDPLIVGAVKSNIGHLEGTSGLAGIVKTVLALEKGIIPPIANLETLNPDIDDEFFRLKFPQINQLWPQGEQIRRASVNSFGFGGTNAHVVLDDASSYIRFQQLKGCHLPEPNTSYEDSDQNAIGEWPGSVGGQRGDVTPPFLPKLLVLSASDEPGLAAQISAHASYLQKQKSYDDPNLLSNYSYTLIARRTLHAWRSFGVFSSTDELTDISTNMSMPTQSLGRTLSLGLVFTGQGAQWIGMGQQLIEERVFRSSLLRSQNYLKQFQCDFSVLDCLAEAKFEHGTSIDEAKYSQILTTCLQLALIDVVEWLEIQTSVVIGHSSGEIAAAYAAGHISHQSAIKISYYRGILATKLETESAIKHSMAAVGLSPDAANVIIRSLERKTELGIQAGCINISCINSPSSVTVSGPDEHIDTIVRYLTEQHIFIRKLKVKVGYHSPQMSEVSEEYLDLLGSIETRDTQLVSRPTMVSSVTGSAVGINDVCVGTYWVRNMVSHVDFLGAMKFCQSPPGEIWREKTLDFKSSRLSHMHIDAWFEIGPHATLKTPILDTMDLRSSKGKPVYTSALIRHTPAISSLLASLGLLYCCGFSLNTSRMSTLGLSDPMRTSLMVLSNVPKYQFNHSVRYWEESDLNKSVRFRKHGIHDLLGLRITEPNHLESQWKFIIKEDEMAWVKDHQVNGTTLYPAAGMVVMAIEAMKQLVQGRLPLAVELCNIEFPAPIVVPSTSRGVEIRLHMSSVKKSEMGATDYKFRIFVCKADHSHEVVCSGTIRGDYGRIASEVDGGNEDSRSPHCTESELSKITSACTTVMDTAKMYQSICDTTGIYYGPNFQALDQVHLDGTGQALAVILPYDSQSVSEYTVHPSRLDGMFQLGFAAMCTHAGLKTMVPTRLNRMWLPLSGFGNPSTSIDNAYTQLQEFSDRHAIFNIKTISALEMSLKAVVDGLEVTAVALGIEAATSLADAKYICSHIIWKPDIEMLDTNEIFQYCESARNTEREPVEWSDNMDTLALEYGVRALRGIERDGRKVAASMEKYVAWLRAQIDMRPSIRPKTNAELEQIHHNVLPSTRGEMHITIGQHLPSILCGLADPFEMIFKDDVKIADFYRELMEDSTGLGPFSRYLDILVHGTPDLRFLEIGGGTGSTTKTILRTIGDMDIGSRFQEYVFTDISPFFLDKARKEFSQQERMSYHVLNIELDVADQGFSTGFYDVIVADNVLHATRNIRSTVLNLRKLLRPGGKLILKELVNPERLLIGLLFGLLPGWWLSHEKERQLSPLLSEDSWDGVLKECGFSGTDIIFRDHIDTRCRLWSIMVSTATEMYPNTISAPENPCESLAFICRPASPLQEYLADKVFSELGHIGVPRMIRLSEASELSDKQPNTLDFIFLYETEGPILRDIREADFTYLKTVIKNARSLLWVKAGGNSCSSLSVDYAISEGLNRVVRLENGRVALVSLTLGDLTSLSFINISKVSLMMQDARSKGSLDFEQEYSEINGVLCTNRLQKATRLNEHIFKQTAQPVLRQRLGEQKLKLAIRAPGLLDTIQFSEDETFKQPIGIDEVDIEVRAIGINYKDCLALLGRLNSDRYGSECVGIIREKGNGVIDLKVGDRVLVGSQDTFKTYVRAHKNNVIQIPQSMSFNDAAAIFTAYCTAYHSIINVARIQEGHSILIHSAAGGTGQAMVQISHYAKAKVFATVGSLAKKKLLMDNYNIPEDHIFYSRDSSFADGIKRMTHGQGVNVIINSLAGRLLEASWQCIAPFGHFIDIGLKDAFLKNDLPMHVFSRNATFSGVNLTTICENLDGYNKKLMQEVLTLFVKGRVKVQCPLQIFSLEDTELAFRSLQTGQSSGKMVIQVDKGGLLPIVQFSGSDFYLHSEATYVISGGLGGIGRNVARWLVKRGAKHLILISRSGPDCNVPAQAMLAAFNEENINVQCPMCDVGDIVSLENALAECLKTMPPIRGCVQAAMSISDTPFAKMSIDQWKQATSPKIQGSWNLHVALPTGLDFFILFSSCCGISGNSGQANYAAGNTYQDALARYRTSIGEKAMSLDLGVVRGEGFFGDNQQLLDRLLRLDMLATTSYSEIFAIMDYYCNPRLPNIDASQSQVVTGFNVPADILAKGKDIPTPMQKPLFRYLLQARGSTNSTHTSFANQQTFNSAFKNAPTDSEKVSVVSQALRVKLSKVMGIHAEEMDFDQPLTSFGVDSLVGLELQNWLVKETGIDLAVFEILGGLSMNEIGITVMERSKLESGGDKG